MMEIDFYTSRLQQWISPRRLAHSLGVMQTMTALSAVYSLDQEKAETVGLLHDVAKEVSDEQVSFLIEEGGIKIGHPCERDSFNYLHGPLGAYLVKKEFGIQDADILDAIYSHTFLDCGASFDDPLCWCMRFSDLLEPNRDWSQWDWMDKGVEQLREAAFCGHMVKAALIQTNLVIRLFTVHSVVIHPNFYRVKDRLTRMRAQDE